MSVAESRARPLAAARTPDEPGGLNGWTQQLLEVYSLCGRPALGFLRVGIFLRSFPLTTR